MLGILCFNLSFFLFVFLFQVMSPRLKSLICDTFYSACYSLDILQSVIN